MAVSFAALAVAARRVARLRLAQLVRSRYYPCALQVTGE